MPNASNKHYKGKWILFQIEQFKYFPFSSPYSIGVSSYRKESTSPGTNPLLEELPLFGRAKFFKEVNKNLCYSSFQS